MSLSSVANIPKAKQGEFCVNVSQRDRGAASDFADIANRKIVSRNPQRSGAKRDRGFEPAVTLEDIVLVDERLKVPCIGFWFTGIGTLLIGIILTAAAVLSLNSPAVKSILWDAYPVAEPAIYAIGPVFSIMWVVPLFAAHSLRRHRNFHLVAVLLLAMIALGPWISPLFVVQIPLAIWALVVLCLPSSRRVFRDASLRERMGAKKPPVLQQIPRWVFAAAIIGPFMLVAIGLVIWSGLAGVSSTSVVAADPIVASPPSDPTPRFTLEAEEMVSGKVLDRWRTESESGGMNAPEPAFAPLPVPKPGIVHRSTAVRPVRATGFKNSISRIGYLGIVFVVFVMVLLMFMLAMLARSMIRGAAKR